METTELPLGAVLPARYQFIRQIVVQRPDQDVDLEIPGRVWRCDGAAGASVRPRARLVLPGGLVPRAAVVTAAVSDEAELARSIAEIGGKFAFRELRRFAIRVVADRLSYTDLVTAAEETVSGGGCCSGCGSATFRPAAIRAGFSNAKEGDLLWTNPVRAVIRLGADVPMKHGPIDPEAKAALVAEDCDSEWWIRGFWGSRETTCHGDCDNGQLCYCRKDDKGNRLPWCPGWTFCWCS